MDNITTKESFEEWLASLDLSSIATMPFPVERLLEGSLYYPSCGFDGDPVRLLGRVLQSFVYVDYGKSEEDLNVEIRDNGFRGYEVLAKRSVLKRELTPNGWHPTNLEPTDGNPLGFRESFAEPFCTWYVFKKTDKVLGNHGPERFSLLFLCADGVAAYQALYTANHLKPKVVAIIQPGTGFGMNWAAFEDPTKIFCRTVLGNPAGVPEELLFGGIGLKDFYLQSCWPSYAINLGFFDKAGGGTIGRWGRS